MLVKTKMNKDNKFNFLAWEVHAYCAVYNSVVLSYQFCNGIWINSIEQTQERVLVTETFNVSKQSKTRRVTNGCVSATRVKNLYSKIDLSGGRVLLIEEITLPQK